MPAKPIFDIDVNDTKFREFKRMFDQYTAAMKGMPAAWALVNLKIDGTRTSFDKLVETMTAANIQEKLRAKAQERADQLTRTAADRWRDMARTTRAVAGNIKESTAALLKWSGVIGAVSGLLGAGGIWGIDRLAIGVGQSRRSALGLGTTIGGQKAFASNFERLVSDPDSFLGAIAGAKYDVTKRVGLLGAGLSQGEINADTATTGVAMLRRLKAIADQTNPALYAQVLQARRLDQFAGPEDLARLHGTSAAEFEQLVRQYGRRQQDFGLKPDVARQWQDFSTQMSNAGKSIETTFIRGLAPLVPAFTKLSEGAEKVIHSFLAAPALKEWLDKAGAGLEHFAEYVGSDEFQKKVEKFAEVIGRAVEWLDAHLPAAKTVWQVGTAAVQFGQGVAGGFRVGAAVTGGAITTARDWLMDYNNYMQSKFGKMSMDDLLGVVRQSERSGDRAVSPAGAIGRYQIMPGTAAMYGVGPDQLFDPATNEAVARKYLASLVKKYHGSTDKILAAYNAGPGREDAVLAGKSSLPAETQRYVQGAHALSGYAPAVVTIENNTGGNATVSVNGLKN